MSQQGISTFRQKVAGSPELQQQIRAGVAGENFDIAALGKSHGCEFTADEVSVVLSSGELSDFELEMVSGGATKAVGSTGREGTNIT